VCGWLKTYTHIYTYNVLVMHDTWLVSKNRDSSRTHRTRTHVHMHARTHTHTHTHAQTQAHAHAHTRTHTHFLALYVFLSFLSLCFSLFPSLLLSSSHPLPVSHTGGLSLSLSFPQMHLETHFVSFILSISLSLFLSPFPSIFFFLFLFFFPPLSSILSVHHV